MKFEDLLVTHDYYCSSANYYANDAEANYPTWEAFYQEFKDMDLDLNLCFRWDIRKHEEGEHKDGYYMEVFIMQQRKGKFVPISIDLVEEKDFEEIKTYLSKHWGKINAIWQPISSK